MNAYDLRIKRLISSPHTILITNYKCGFSSSNLLKYELVTELSENDQVIFIYRNIHRRAISTFINWSITDDRYFRNEGWLLENLFTQLGPHGYRRFVELLFTREYETAFDIYVESLDAISHKNDHTLPQINILNQYDIREIGHFIELENCSDFRKITGVEFPHDTKNRSNTDIKKRLIEHLNSNQNLVDELRRIYAVDLDYFLSNKLNMTQL